MNRDAKIGIVVVLVIVGLLIIIWGRSGDRNDEAVAPKTDATTTAGTGGTPGTLTTGTGNLPIPGGLTMPTTGGPPHPTGTTGVGPTGTLGVGPTGTTGVSPTTTQWEYTVVQGDRGLQQISRDKLGDTKRWKEIAQLNNMKAPYSLRIGQKLKMPSKTVTTTAGTTTGTTTAGTGTVGPVGPTGVGPTGVGPTGVGPTGTGTDLGVGPVGPTGTTGGTDLTGPVGPAGTGTHLAGTSGTTGTAGTTAVATRKYKIPADVLCLSQIAREQLGSAGKWKSIADLNHLAAPYTIHAGQTILLPQ